MNVGHPDLTVAAIAAAIGEPARARMLFCLMDGHARTSTELAVVGEVSPSTASAHLSRLKAERLVEVVVQGKHRYYRLDGPHVAVALEALSVVAGRSRETLLSPAPSRLKIARTCYDHMAGTLAVALHDRFSERQWLSASSGDNAYELTNAGTTALETLEIDVASIRALRRRFAFPCLDWSERRPHIGGALGAAILLLALKKRWVVRELDSRALNLTRVGRRELLLRFGVRD